MTLPAPPPLPLPLLPEVGGLKLGEGKKEGAADISEGWEDDEWEVSLLHDMQNAVVTSAACFCL